MQENQKQEVAVFRFSVIADFIHRKDFGRGEIKQLLDEKCARKWDIPHSDRTRISKTTIREWIKRYRDSVGRLESLYPLDRSDSGRSRALNDDTAQGLLVLRKELPKMPLTVLLKEAKSREIIPVNETVSYSSAYRLMEGAGFTGGVPLDPEDRRKFEAEYPGKLWQSDVMHGPYVMMDGKKKKTYLIAIIDDMSRLITHAEFYFSEKTVHYLDTLHQAVAKRGVPIKLYVDNGAAFRSKHLAHVCASLGIVLIHAKPYSPQGKGKIERWFGTVRSNFLTRYREQGDTLDKLNKLLEIWVDEYNNSKHSATKTTPMKRYITGLDGIRMPPSDMDDHFRKVVRRTVASDRTITLDGILYEVPMQLVGKRIEMLYHEDNMEKAEVRYSGKGYGIVKPVNVQVNGKIKRSKKYTELESSDNDVHSGGLFE